MLLAVHCIERIILESICVMCQVAGHLVRSQITLWHGVMPPSNAAYLEGSDSIKGNKHCQLMSDSNKSSIFIN